MTRTVIAHVTDSHLGQRLTMNGGSLGTTMHYVEDADAHRSHLRRVLADIAQRGIADVIFGGDIGSPATVPVFFREMRDHDFTLDIVLGNHDSYASVRPWCGPGAVEGKLCSSIGVGPWRRITLDSSDNTIGECQLAWLASELEGAPRAAIFVHHPVLDVDTPVDRSSAALQDRATLKALLNGLNCEVTLFCGHYHMIDERREANIRQFVTPAVSYQIVKRSDRIRVDTNVFGYRIIVFDGAEIQTQIMLGHVDGLEQDRFGSQ